MFAVDTEDGFAGLLFRVEAVPPTRAFFAVWGLPGTGFNPIRHEGMRQR